MDYQEVLRGYPDKIKDISAKCVMWTMACIDMMIENFIQKDFPNFGSKKFDSIKVHILYIQTILKIWLNSVLEGIPISEILLQHTPKYKIEVV